MKPSIRPLLDEARLVSDFPYFAANLLWIDTKSEGPQPFHLNSIQRLLWYGRPADYDTNPRYRFTVIPEKGWGWKFQNGIAIRDVILKFRQGGISTLGAGLAFWQVWGNFARKALLIAHNEETSAHLLEMCKNFLRYLPDAYKPSVLKNNAGQILFDSSRGGLHSSITIQTAGNLKAGHGKTFHILCLSEIARWPNPEETLVGLLETVPKGIDERGTAIIYESTAELASDYFHGLYQAARSGQSAYTPIFLPWYLQETYRKAPPPGYKFDKGLLEFKKDFALDDDQVYWYDEEIRKANGNLKLVQRSYPSTETEAFINAGYSVFPEKALEHFQRKVRRPIKEGEIVGGRILWKGGRLKVWEMPRDDSSYLIGADVSLGVGQSQSVIEVFAHPGYRQVAEWASQYVDARAFAHIIQVIGQFYNNAVAAVEINNAGVLTNAELETNYGNCYYWKYFNRTKAPMNKLTGWNTTHEIKVLMVTHVISLMTNEPPRLMIRSAALLDQMKSFLDYGGDIYRHAPNARDDLVMAMMIAVTALWQEYVRHDMSELGRIVGEDPVPDYAGVANRDMWDPADSPAGMGRKDHWLLL